MGVTASSFGQIPSSRTMSTTATMLAVSERDENKDHLSDTLVQGPLFSPRNIHCSTGIQFLPVITNSISFLGFSHTTSHPHLIAHSPSLRPLLVSTAEVVLWFQSHVSVFSFPPLVDDSSLGQLLYSRFV